MFGDEVNCLYIFVGTVMLKEEVEYFCCESIGKLIPFFVVDLFFVRP